MSQCTQTVWGRGRFCADNWQCNRKAKEGDKCSIHTPAAIAKRERERDERDEKRIAAALHVYRELARVREMGGSA